MTGGMDLVPEQLAQLSDHVSTGAVGAVDAAIGTNQGTRLASGTFSLLEIGPVAGQIADGITDRLDGFLQDFRSRFEDVADKIEQNRVDYVTAETTNTELTGGVEV